MDAAEPCRLSNVEVTSPVRGRSQANCVHVEPRTLKAGLCFCALAQPQFCWRLVTLGGQWGCAGPGRSMGPPPTSDERKTYRCSGPRLHPRPPPPVRRTPSAPRARRGSLVADFAPLRLSTHLGRYVVAYPPGSFRLHRTLPSSPCRSPSDRPGVDLRDSSTMATALWRGAIPWVC